MENKHLILKLAEKIYAEEDGLTWYEALEMSEEIIKGEGEEHDING